MQILKNLNPKNVFSYFEDICAIPHGSSNTKQISDYCVNFAKSHNLYYHQDSQNNIIIKKPASKGYENHPPVILQGHLDMVCQKEDDFEFDFKKDGLKLFIKDDKIGAKSTTLGADDGICIAMTLAILSDTSLSHPPIEALFTVDEETGMFGAINFDASYITGNRLINIDSSEQSVLTVGCAGGTEISLTLPLKKSSVKMPLIEIEVSGLIGGHSGTEIDKGRQNANLVMANFLNSLDFDYNIVNIFGGTKHNVIPGKSNCIIATNGDIKSNVHSFLSKNKVETDPELNIKITPLNKSGVGFNKKSTQNIKNIIKMLPFGPINYSDELDIVKTSANLGVLNINDNILNMIISVRSIVLAERESTVKKIIDIANKIGCQSKIIGQYPAWEYKKNSPLRNIMVDEYKNLFNEEPKIKVIHAGLECGILAGKIKNLDAVSIGPDMWDIHSTKERLSISSTQNVYKYILKVLEKL